MKKNDSLKKKEVLTDIVEHSADSLIKQDVKNNTVILYKNAKVIYGDIDLQAGYIEINNNTSVITARGIKDSIGEYSQLPVFKQGSQQSTQDSLQYNFKSEKAKIWNLKTEQEGLIIRGEFNKKYNDSILFLENIKITSSEKENPDYYIATKKAKYIKDSKLVAGRSQLYIADVPTPAVLPFAYVPLTKGRNSGFLMPSYGENDDQGFFLQNGGYYFVVSDNMDLALLADIYTNGSWGLSAESSYKKRYKNSGSFTFSYENLITSTRGFDDYAKTSNYNLRWSHSQDSKASPNSRFSASVNMGSSKYYKESNNEYNTNSFLNNTLSSSVSYYKNFVDTPFNLSLSLTHSQNTNTEVINMTLPSLQVSMDRIYPFAGKGGAKNNALQKAGLTYSLKSQNSVSTTDDEFFKSEMWEDMESGVQQNVSLSTSMTALKYLTLSPSLSYEEVWYFDRLHKEWDDDAEEVVTDTISGFNSFREYSTSLSLSTTFYGMFKFKKGKIEAIRHTVRPSISYTYKPDFSFYYEEYQQSDDPTDIATYSPFANGIYGSPGTGLSNSLSFSVSNNIEAKLRQQDSTATQEAEKLTLLNSLSLSTSYNMAADSLKWSPVSVSAGTKLFKDKVSVNGRATLDPYALDATGTKINTFNIENGGSLFRVTSAGLTLNYSLSSQDNSQGQSGQNQYQSANNSDGIFGENLQATNRNTGNQQQNNNGENESENKLYQASIPWSLKVAYALNYSNSARQNEITSHSIMFSGDMELTPKWSLGFSSGYDLEDQGFSYTQLRFSRDLDSWKLNFNWVPFGTRETYYFYIGVKSSMLSDLKYDKTKSSDKVLY